ncbi:MAG: HEAT repeat domain-containing protein [Planctomycetota bacterium]|nr:HEAT repeat domain-containing protein [Planctomycetota bacterium]
MMKANKSWLLAMALVCGLVGALVAFPPPAERESAKVDVKPASEEAQKAIAGFQIPAGYTGSVFAAEPHLANPVAFSIDHQGRAYVVESFRVHAGVTDIRGHMDWLDDDLACRTVGDRRAMMIKRTGNKFSEYEGKPERIRRIVDTNGDGKADEATIFAEGFSRAEDGLGAGVLARGESVYFTCIPSLWKLDDPKNRGVASKTTALSTGFGVHVGFIGHDLHGLIMGPDGRLYFSIGDRGLNVKTAKGDLVYPDMGAVMRCWPDGSELEIFATGLRNPQELLFDNMGNLFTGDNNSDGGDQARWTHLVQGGDSGWRIGFQFLEQPNARGPWNSEGMWKPRHAQQPAHIIPPILNIGAGPSGVFADPGTGLDPAQRGSFFMVDFRGAPGGSGIHSFKLKPKGAGFELTDRKNFLWNILATDAEVGPDGALYVLDWVNGWGLTGKGRIYRFAHESLATDPKAKSTKDLLFTGMTGRTVEELAMLLGHDDRRVRQEAQFALADRGESVALALVAVHGPGLARIHGIWGLGQIARKDPKALAPARLLLKDPDSLVRSQAARVLGDNRDIESQKGLADLTKDPDPVVVREAGLALARLQSADNFAPAVALLRGNDNGDAIIRHAATMALASTQNEEKIAKLMEDGSPAVRLGAVLALRRLGSEKLAQFLSDPDLFVATEATRAIYDTPQWESKNEARIKAVAVKLGQPNTNDSIQLRALAAHNRLGTEANARAIAEFASLKSSPVELRREALSHLRNWAKPSGRDPVVGLWRPLLERDGKVAIAALNPHWGSLLSSSGDLRKAAIDTATSLGIRSLEPRLREMVAERGLDTQTRIVALESLVTLKDKEAGALGRKLTTDTDSKIRAAGWSAMAKIEGKKAQKELLKVAREASPLERQAALAALAKLPSPEVESLIEELLAEALQGKLPRVMDLELEEAIKARKSPALVKAFGQLLEKNRPLNLEGFEAAMEGGDAEKGRQLFLYKGELACQRCHQIGEAGGIVGPALHDIGVKKDRKYLLESLIFPNRQIAEGFETLVVTLHSGKTLTGILKAESATELTLLAADGQTLKVKKSDIDERQKGLSAMPADLPKHLTKSEIRDLIEFLAQQKSEKK